MNYAASCPTTWNREAAGWELEEEWESEATFTFDGVPADVKNLLRARREREAVVLAIRHGDRNENHLSDLVFFNRHPERGGKFISRSEPSYTKVSREWISIRDAIVRPALRSSRPAPKPRPGTGKGGKRIARPEDVHYLALEGGGGKGVTYLGAVRALERLRVLPIDISRPGQNQLKGISGASAGAISALMLAVGMNSNQVGQILSHEETFAAFYDGPDVGRFRLVDVRNRPAIKDARSLPANACAAGMTVARYVLSSAVLGTLLGPASATILANRERYLCNMLFDGGLFPGFAARSFLAGIINQYLGHKLAEHPGQNGGTVGFELFYQLTGVDLVITGTNITRQRPGLFSRRHTPSFPVAEAVGISLSIPPAFKPVFVEANVPVGPFHTRADAYHGLWVDGGVLNNLPIHAFDSLAPAGSGGALHPNVLGLRLTDGPCAGQNGSSQARTSTFILPYLSSLLGTLLYPSEEGQLRSPSEAGQTIDLRTYCLETLEFAPPEDKKREPILQAERAVDRYFQPAP